MLSVKIKFCSLDWYSSSSKAIVLYKRTYMCKMFPSNPQKLKKRKCDLLEISSGSPKAGVAKLRPAGRIRPANTLNPARR